MMGSIICSAPDYLAGKRLINLAENDLTCDLNNTQMLLNMELSSTTQSITSVLTESTKHLMQKKTTELDIIWSMPSTEKFPPEKIKATSIGRTGTSQSTLNNDDTLIIGIVGGVVAFIAILVMIICIVRLKISSNRYHQNGAVTTAGTSSIMAPGGINGSRSSCACSVIGGQQQQSDNILPTAFYTFPPNYAQSGYSLPIKMSTVSQNGSGRMPDITYSTLGRSPYQGTNPLPPYFIAANFSLTEDKVYR